MASSRSAVELFHPGKSFKFPKCKSGAAENREWCESYPWLYYDVASDSAFCHLCMRAVSEGKLLASTKRDPAFISKGYTYRKEATVLLPIKGIVVCAIHVLCVHFL